MGFFCPPHDAVGKKDCEGAKAVGAKCKYNQGGKNHIGLGPGIGLQHDKAETAGSARPLMDAFRVAHYEMVKWLVDEYGFESVEAIQLVSQVGRARVGNVCDPNYTVVAKFPKKFLPASRT